MLGIGRTGRESIYCLEILRASMLEIVWCIEVHDKSKSEGAGVHTSSSISKRVKPPNFGSSDGMTGGV
jgi:hypothetical protein